MTADPTAQVELFLTEEKRCNEEEEILPSENRVIDRLLASSYDMRSVYEELVQMEADEWQRVVCGIVTIAAFWNPDEMKKTRDAKRTLLDLNEEITSSAFRLAELLEQRTEVAEQSSFDAHDDDHILDWLERAGEQNPLYGKFIKKKIGEIKASYDLKYWPKQGDVIRAIALFSKTAEVTQLDSASEAGISSRKRSINDFYRALFVEFDELRNQEPSNYSVDVQLSDNALAEIGNCALDLESDDLVEPTNIKDLRMRLRNASRYVFDRKF